MVDKLYIGALYDAGIVQYDDGSEMDQPVMLLYNRASKRAYRIDGEKISGEEAYQMMMLASQTKSVIPGTYDVEIYVNYDDPDYREMVYRAKDAVKAEVVSDYIEVEEESSSSSEESSSSAE